MTKRDIRGTATPLLDWGEQLRATKHKRRILGRRIAITGIGIALLGLTMAFPPAPRENTGNKRGHSSAGIPGIKRGQSC